LEKNGISLNQVSKESGDFITMIKSMVVKLYHTRIGRALIGWGVVHMSFALPMEHLKETPR